MYPNENAIGLTWSPGSAKLLLENKHAASWYSAITSAAAFETAVRLAPPMRRLEGTGSAPQELEAAAKGDSWVSCGA